MCSDVVIQSASAVDRVSDATVSCPILTHLFDEIMQVEVDTPLDQIIHLFIRMGGYNQVWVNAYGYDPEKLANTIHHFKPKTAISIDDINKKLDLMSDKVRDLAQFNYYCALIQVYRCIEMNTASIPLIYSNDNVVNAENYQKSPYDYVEKNLLGASINLLVDEIIMYQQRLIEKKSFMFTDEKILTEKWEALENIKNTIHTDRATCTNRVVIQNACNNFKAQHILFDADSDVMFVRLAKMFFACSLMVASTVFTLGTLNDKAESYIHHSLFSTRSSRFAVEMSHGLKSDLKMLPTATVS